jgi:hypothetical protein
MTPAQTVDSSFKETQPRSGGMLANLTGTPAELRAAAAWSAIPLLVSGVMFCAALALTRESNMALARSLGLAAQSMLRLGEIFFILGLWKFAIGFACNGETQHWAARQTTTIRALTALIVLSALFALAVLLLAPAAASLAHTTALSA